MTACEVLKDLGVWVGPLLGAGLLHHWILPLAVIPAEGAGLCRHIPEI